MKSLLLLFISMFTVVNLFAQDDVPYAEKAAQIQKDVWGNEAPEFKTTTIPANLSNEGAVVLARSYSLQRISKGKFKFMVIAMGSAPHTVKLSTFHERVKINDKAALESFSTIEYQKKLDNSQSFLLIKMTVLKNTFIGVKIIKPDGKEVIVNTSEEVLEKNETKDKKGKLAIPDLQVGDILDYYVSNVEITEAMEGNSFKDNDNLFILADEYPILYYSLDFQFSKRVKVQYIYANGAPHFDESRNDAGDLLLSLKIKNMAKYQSQFWTSPLRQYPYIEIGSTFRPRSTGDYEVDTRLSRFDNNKIAFEKYFIEYPGFDDAEKSLKDYFKSHKALKNSPLDSSMKVLYDEWKFDVFCNYSAKELEDVGDMNYRNANGLMGAKVMCMMLSDLDIDHDILLVASRNSNSLENVYNMTDMDAIIRINGDKPMYMSFNDVVTHFNEIPSRYQGERAVVLHPKRHNAMKYTFTESETVLPVIPSDQNRIEEQLQVSLVQGNMQKIKVTRLVKEQGALRHEDQKSLLPVQDIDNGYMEMIRGEELTKRLKKNQETKKMTDDYAFSFAKEKNEMKKNYESEIKTQYGQEPEGLQDFKVINPALENTNPVFQYTSTFVLNNFVKKAGNNYIIDAGKLTGDFYKLEDKERKRSVDVIMPSARSFKYTISIAIPQGYTAKGVEELTIKKANKTGSFASSAVVNGNVLTITVSRDYKNNFEKVSDWPLLVDMIDAASTFNSAKILFEKQG